MREIRFYVTQEGKVPFQEWRETLRDKKTRNKIRVYLGRLELGNFRNCKFVGEGVFELKIDFGPGYRVYFGQIGSVIIMLLCGGDKNSQERDIKKAKEHWTEYERRQHENIGKLSKIFN